MSNLPHDWDSFWSTCENCNRNVHASEGGCYHCDWCRACDTPVDEGTLDDEDRCAKCAALVCKACGESIDDDDPDGLDERGWCVTCVDAEEDAP